MARVVQTDGDHFAGLDGREKLDGGQGHGDPRAADGLVDASGHLVDLLVLDDPVPGTVGRRIANVTSDVLPGRCERRETEQKGEDHGAHGGVHALKKDGARKTRKTAARGAIGAPGAGRETPGRLLTALGR